MADRQTFGQVIANRRKQKGLSQKDLAARIKKDDKSPITPQYLNDIEHDRRSPSSAHLIRDFAKVLDLSVDTLYFLAGQVPEDIRRNAVQLEKVPDAFVAFRKKLGN